MERLNTRIRGGGTNVWTALAAIVGIFALVLSTLVVASPTASAQDAAEIQSEASENSGVTTAAESDDESGLEADASTAVDEGETPSASDAPSAVNPTVAPSDDETLVPETLGEQAFSLRAPNDRIDVNVTKIEGVPEADQQLVVGQKARVEGTWDASKADPQPGDSFTVGFPSQLKIPAGASFPLVSEDSETYGTCTVNSDNSFTCVLNDSVTGKDDVKGTWFIEATATEYTNAENLDFTVPGDKVTVPLPGDGGGISDGTKLDFKKQGAVQPDQSSIRWTVDIPGNMLAALETPNDGNVTLRDKLPEGLKVCEPIRDSKLSVGRTGFQEIPDGLTLEPGATGQIQIGVNANEPFKNDQIYRVEYTTCTTNGGVLTQGKYENQFFVGDVVRPGFNGG